MLLFIDNYDSFTYNIVQYLGQLGEEIIVKNNDEITLQDISVLAPEKIVIGPGPCTPKEAGISVAAIKQFGAKIPILGICLGHQSIGYAFGADIVRAKQVMHGKTSPVYHHNSSVFANLPNPVNCTRYHSLVINKETLPDCLEITAWTDDNEIMGIRHKTQAIEGVQFHPEGLLTENGYEMLHNFLQQHQNDSSNKTI
ncbi:anthranilate/aminodeoxychorismate synthase component II [Snodgrassella communis]|uniref:Anthranilate synthase, amidotransferase component / Para-aminobenzoate synthase, amidotransferase component n=1 Tax=Snodgrassella communis TaxID=2946699 RepID=A0A066TJ50_9NEIS|nr:aminodeoxychorismate/anthranilate synthase component II [Snodgrassella communis]KDN12822.1 Anthranilate synthase, amidotransferase component / Para-aminobenzoate synthase, amidotransferase component [Snodgrassella communis]KDN15131.1 Anthranilate synthase, amidotransferase component / Para-aminobenzoate synthase, amidotransferase component [Snodgrassella communis]PIT10241.1 anthranilate/aminodeoxychorismate synthase component II [Snodgrassella communis]PIT26757.1 anthranilate/aminodeoxychori